jgi:hypothetical protein
LTGYGGIVRLKKSRRDQSHVFTEQLEKHAADIEANYVLLMLIATIAHMVTLWFRVPEKK